MIRHIFMATVKEGVSDEVVCQKMDEMRAMKNSVPASPAHCAVADKADEAFCTDHFVMAQIEI